VKRQQVPDGSLGDKPALSVASPVSGLFSAAQEGVPVADAMLVASRK
jgi:hypothetical protein